MPISADDNLGPTSNVEPTDRPIPTGAVTVLSTGPRMLTISEKKTLQLINDKGREFYEVLRAAGVSRELSIALTKTEEAIMWANKAITR
jgi:hypothetical protein